MRRYQQSSDIGSFPDIGEPSREAVEKMDKETEILVDTILRHAKELSKQGSQSETSFLEALRNNKELKGVTHVLTLAVALFQLGRKYPFGVNDARAGYIDRGSQANAIARVDTGEDVYEPAQSPRDVDDALPEQHVFDVHPQRGREYSPDFNQISERESIQKVVDETNRTIDALVDHIQNALGDASLTSEDIIDSVEIVGEAGTSFEDRATGQVPDSPKNRALSQKNAKQTEDELLQSIGSISVDASKIAVRVDAIGERYGDTEETDEQHEIENKLIADLHINGGKTGKSSRRELYSMINAWNKNPHSVDIRAQELFQEALAEKRGVWFTVRITTKPLRGKESTSEDISQEARVRRAKNISFWMQQTSHPPKVTVTDEGGISIVMEYARKDPEVFEQDDSVGGSSPEPGPGVPPIEPETEPEPDGDIITDPPPIRNTLKGQLKQPTSAPKLASRKEWGKKKITREAGTRRDGIVPRSPRKNTGKHSRTRRG